MPRWTLALLAATEACSWGCGASPITPTDTAILGSETDQQVSCVVDNRGDAGAINRCRAGVKELYDRMWAAKFGDSGVSP